MSRLCKLSEVTEKQARGFSSSQGPVFVVKESGDYHVYANECPHLGVNLEFEKDDFLDSDGSLIQCSMHGALFDKATGLCLSGPCQGKHLRKIDFIVSDGDISV